MASKTSRNLPFLLALCALSLLVRVLFFGGYLSREQRFVTDDSPEYHMMATQLAAGVGYIATDGTPYVYRVPGYPFFLSLCYRVCGPNRVLALWVQVVLASLIPLLIFFLSLALFPMQLALAKAASLLSAVHIGFLVSAGSLMTESLFLLFFLSFLLWFVLQLQKPPRAPGGKKTFEQSYLYDPCPEPGCEGPSYLELFGDVQVQGTQARVPVLPPGFFLAGLLLGIASLIRPVGPLVFALSLLWVVVASVQRVRRGLSLTLGWLVVVTPWLVRNYLIFGLVAFHSLPGPHFLNLSASRVVMQVQDIGFDKAKKQLNNEVREAIAGRNLNELERSRVQLDVALGHFKAHPLLALRNWATDIMRTALSLHSSFIMHLEQGRKKIRYFSRARTIPTLFARYLMPTGVPWWVVALIWLEIITYGLLLLGLAEGLLHSLRFKQNIFPWLYSLSYIALFITIGLAGGYARMRLPIEGLIAILGLRYWVQKWRASTAR